MLNLRRLSANGEESKMLELLEAFGYASVFWLYLIDSRYRREIGETWAQWGVLGYVFVPLIVLVATFFGILMFPISLPMAFYLRAKKFKSAKNSDNGGQA